MEVYLSSDCKLNVFQCFAGIMNPMQKDMPITYHVTHIGVETFDVHMDYVFQVRSENAEGKGRSAHTEYMGSGKFQL